MTRLRVALAQLNLVVGDLDRNTERIRTVLTEAAQSSCDLVAFPELAVTGYPPEDLLLKESFVTDNLAALEDIARATTRTAAVVGFVDRVDGLLYNATAVCVGGRVLSVHHKRVLPNYAVFDEQRYFRVGSRPLEVCVIAGVPVGVTVCEEAWTPDGPIAELAGAGAALVVNCNASPFHAGKVDLRAEMLAARVAESGCAIAYVNLVGGQDELVFDGVSMVVDATGAVCHRAPSCAEALLIADLDLEVAASAPGGSATTAQAAARTVSATSLAIEEPVLGPEPEPIGHPAAQVYDALVLGTADYVRKNGFSDIVIGLSGGIDSTLVAAIATDALGADHVHGVLMPSRYSSGHSVDDATTLATRLGIDHRVVPIEPGFAALTAMLAPSFEGTEEDLTEENLQSRIRGVVLMALSNKFGWMVLTTSNKSEAAVGYSTLYGDSAGGFAVIKDVPKLLVYELCRLRNERSTAQGAPAPIPESVLVKPPSAELRPDQRDDDSLPPYEVLDPILEAYVERDRTIADLVADGYDEHLVARIARLVDVAEYKRRQFPPGPRVTTKAFGKDRRLPITNGYRG